MLTQKEKNFIAECFELAEYDFRDGIYPIFTETNDGTSSTSTLQSNELRSTAESVSTVPDDNRQIMLDAVLYAQGFND